LPVVQTMWIREHNRHARHLKQSNPDWDDWKLFHRARQFVIAELQWIVKNEYLSTLGINLSAYKGYDSSVDPRIDNAFTTAAFRFGHSMLSALTLELEAHERSTCSQATAVRMCQHFFDPDRSLLGDNPTSTNIDSIIRGLATAPAQKVDLLLIEDVRTFLFSPPFPYKRPRMDLAAVNIQRGRDHGLLDYNSYRELYGLKKVKSFSEITSDVPTASALQALYEDKVDNVDLFVGLLAEDHAPADEGALRQPSAAVGPLLMAMMRDQFQRLVSGDRFWFENAGNGLFSHEEISALRNFSYKDLLASNSGVQEADIGNYNDPLATGKHSAFFAPVHTVALGGNSTNTSPVCAVADIQKLLAQMPSCKPSLCATSAMDGQWVCRGDPNNQQWSITWYIYGGFATTMFSIFFGIAYSRYCRAGGAASFSSFVMQHTLDALPAVISTGIKKEAQGRDVASVEFFGIEEEKKLPIQARRPAFELWQQMKKTSSGEGVHSVKESADSLPIDVLANAFWVPQKRDVYFERSEDESADDVDEATRATVISVISRALSMMGRDESEIEVRDFVVFLNSLLQPSQDELTFKIVFSNFDINGDNRVSFDEFDTLIQWLKQDNPHIPADEIDSSKLWSGVDWNGKDSLDIDDFLALMKKTNMAPQIHLPFHDTSPLGVFINAYRVMQHESEYVPPTRAGTGAKNHPMQYLRSVFKYYNNRKFIGFQVVYWALTGMRPPPCESLSGPRSET
jgi:hypothetical protein